MVSNVKNPYSRLLKDLSHYGKYYSLPDLDDPRYAKLPYCIRVLLESAIRCCDDFEVLQSHVETILNWKTACLQSAEIPFKPSRVLLQDLTGVAVQVDLAAMRDAMQKFGGDPTLINPLVPVDLVIDHSVQVDASRVDSALAVNQEIEFNRNRERFGFLKWAASTFKNMLIVPPGSGIVHQVNLEYLARVVFCENGILYPDSVVGTDSHTTMIDGLGITGWGVGGIEAEAVMLGQPICMTLPEVVGVELIGTMPEGTTATDLVLKLTRLLRDIGVVGKFVEFYGPSCQSLTIADRATVSNMSPEYGATMGYFPVDAQTLSYLKLTGRPKDIIELVEAYYKAQRIFRMYDANDTKIEYTTTVQLDLSTILPCISGPKRPHDYVPLCTAHEDFRKCLVSKVGFKGYGLSSETTLDSEEFMYNGVPYTFKHGCVVIAAITSCTNTSNPHVMIGAGLIAKKAIELGLKVKPYIKTSLSPGSLTVTKYLEKSGLAQYLEKLGFYTTGYGCQTCIGNSGDLDAEVLDVINKKNFVACAVLSGNRNFEGRIHPATRANYLMSPMLVVIYALAGTVNIDLYHTPLGHNLSGQPGELAIKYGGATYAIVVFMSDIMPSAKEIEEVCHQAVLAEMFNDVYCSIKDGGSENWKNLQAAKSELYPWDPTSSYIHDPPYLKSMGLEPSPIQNICEAHCLLFLGDSVTTDHISPAGAIAKGSPASVYLEQRSIQPKDYNTYGSRRGHDEVMVRGTFANNRLINALAKKVGPYTLHVPTDKQMFIYDAAMAYQKEGIPTIVLAGKEYGCGSSRDWAAKGPNLLGIKAILASSYERIHRSNLIGMGIVPLQFMENESAATHGLTGHEKYTIFINEMQKPNEVVRVEVKRPDASSFTLHMKSRIDTLVEFEYFRHGGILQYVLRKILAAH